MIIFTFTPDDHDLTDNKRSVFICHSTKGIGLGAIFGKSWMIFANCQVTSSQASCASVILEVHGFFWQLSLIKQFCKIHVLVQAQQKNYRKTISLHRLHSFFLRVKLNMNRSRVHPRVEDEMLPSRADECRSDIIVLLSQTKGNYTCKVMHLSSYKSTSCQRLCLTYFFDWSSAKAENSSNSFKADF